MKTTYSFEIHKYAPELNKIFIDGVDKTHYYPTYLKKSLTGDYKSNLRTLREYLSFDPFNHFITISYIGEKCGFEKSIQGGFDDWKKAMTLIHRLRSWFTTETPVREAHFLF